jgi:hypothetical protein
MYLALDRQFGAKLVSMTQYGTKTLQEDAISNCVSGISAAIFGELQILPCVCK